jgi:hypothetical protein
MRGIAADSTIRKMEREMSKLVNVAVAAMSVLALTTVAQAGNAGRILTTPNPTGISTVPLQIRPVVACVVAGTPSEFPDDIFITNKGAVTVAAGTMVHWSVPFAGKQGNFALPAALASGKSVFVSGVLPGGVEAGQACKAAVI